MRERHRRGNPCRAPSSRNRSEVGTGGARRAVAWLRRLLPPLKCSRAGPRGAASTARCVPSAMWARIFPVTRRLTRAVRRALGIAQFCGQNPDAPVVPMVVTGRTTVYEWRCAAGVPVIEREFASPIHEATSRTSGTRSPRRSSARYAQKTRRRRRRVQLPQRSRWAFSAAGQADLGLDHPLRHVRAFARPSADVPKAKAGCWGTS